MTLPRGWNAGRWYAGQVQLSRMQLSALACELVGEFGSGADPKLAVDP
jgi:hypothetical protein